jgi:hypothetical protein
MNLQSEFEKLADFTPLQSTEQSIAEPMGEKLQKRTKGRGEALRTRPRPFLICMTTPASLKGQFHEIWGFFNGYT